MHHQFTMKDGILYCLMQLSGVTHLTLIIPQSLALTLVRSVHLEFQHVGAVCTYNTLAMRVYWQVMWLTVHKYVHVCGCNVCQLCSLKQNTYPSKYNHPPNVPWTRITIDCVHTQQLTRTHRSHDRYMPCHPIPLGRAHPCKKH